jgi:hypothetical protein
MVTVLTKGDCFGELALINNKTRAARIICKEECLFGILKKIDYKNTVGLSIKQDILQKCSFLRNFRIFDSVSDSRLYKITYSLQLRKF